MGRGPRWLAVISAGLMALGGTARSTERDFDAGAGLAAAWSSRDGGLGGGSLRLGLRWWPSPPPPSMPDATTLLLGNVPGVDLHARILMGSPSGRFGTAFTIGLGSGLTAQVGQKRSRVPSLLGLVLPEVGLLARSYSPPRAYVAWSAPLGYQARTWQFLSIELTPTLLLVTASDRVEYVAMVSLSGLGR
jgi:hypothetical protein